jgi:hypothetical protein
VFTEKFIHPWLNGYYVETDSPLGLFLRLYVFLFFLFVCDSRFSKYSCSSERPSPMTHWSLTDISKSILLLLLIVLFSPFLLPAFVVFLLSPLSMPVVDRNLYRKKIHKKLDRIQVCFLSAARLAI